MRVIHHTLTFQTKGHTDIIDLTADVENFIRERDLMEGIMLVFVNGSTAAVSTIEYEPGLLKDIPEILEKLIPSGKTYHHDATWHDGNGYAHLRSTIIGTSETLPVINGQLLRGTWQQIILLDFDNRPRQRTVQLTFTGV